MADEWLERRLREAAGTYVVTRPAERVVVDYKWAASFTFEGTRIPLKDRGRGIRKPKELRAALSISTVFTPPGQEPPYADQEGSDGRQRYKYQGTDPGAPDNVALREAMRDGLPLIWFVGVQAGLYEPVFPVWIVDEEPQQHQFVLALDESQRVQDAGPISEDLRRYREQVTRARLHQPLFRARVLTAYGTRCAVCSLHHAPLLDAAHFIPDGKPLGSAVVPNGLAMCKIHHAAYDSDILGISPDLVVKVRRDILEESDGPMLRHGLQDMHGQPLRTLPPQRAARPDRDRLAARFEEFVRG